MLYGVGINIKSVMKKSYSELLKSPEWQKKRLEIMTRDKFTCLLCGDKQTTLNVHHKEYIKEKLPWEYPDKDLITLCECCHNFIEKIKNIHGLKIEDIQGDSISLSPLSIKLRLYKYCDTRIIYVFGIKNTPIYTAIVTDGIKKTLIEFLK